MMGEAGHGHVDAVAKLLRDADGHVRKAACEALCDMGEAGRVYGDEVAECQETMSSGWSSGSSHSDGSDCYSNDAGDGDHDDDDDGRW